MNYLNKIKGVLLTDKFIPIPFLYNPEEISDEKEVNYAKQDVLGYDNPVYHFVNGGERKLTFTMKLNSNVLDIPASALQAYIETIRELSLSKRGSGIIKRSPPVVRFVFGPLIIQCIITSVSVARKRFSKYLTTKEAELEISLVEVGNKNSILGYRI